MTTPRSVDSAMTVPALRMYQSLREDLALDRLAQLREEVCAHYERLLVAQRGSELIAVDLADALRTRLEILLAMAHLVDAEARANIVGAARYFVASDDEHPDEASCTGLDDDVEVFNHVVRLLDRADLLIED
jgi:chromosome condensin MukBEF complex kleisin-like MukF subunit